jgi:L-aminopeptidase/D-esterase-like protein
MIYEGTITDVAGLMVGHATDREAATGCTVILCREGAVAGADVRGGAPGTRETDLLAPGRTVERVHAVLLTGGSAFGLDAAGGVMRYLEERGIGFDTGAARVPIVPAAVLYDLEVGRADRRPDREMGYAACQSASAAPPEQGRVGAGTGATVGKLMGMAHAMPGGVGAASVKTGGVTVAALVAVNAVGNVVDHRTGHTLAGVRVNGAFADPIALMLDGAGGAPAGVNTTIGVIATDGILTGVQAARLACVAHDGLALSIRPVHTAMDGDTLFALSTGRAACDFNRVCVAAVEAVARAIVNAVTAGERR